MWRMLLKERGHASVSNALFDGPPALPETSSWGSARCILVDSEPKVALSLQRRHRGCFSDRDVHVEQSGRGGNWACGHSDGVKRRRASGSRDCSGNGDHVLAQQHTKERRNFDASPDMPWQQRGFGCGLGSGDVDADPGLAPKVLTSLRRHCEQCDHYTGAVLTHSLAGGTGSGLGSRLAEAVRDEYPANYLTSVVVAPFGVGDNPLEAYNTVLTLHALQQHADAVVMLSNDAALEYLTKKVGGSGGGGNGGNSAKSVTLAGVNGLLASSLANLFLPMQQGPDTFSPFDAADLVASTCPMPQCKLLQLTSVPFDVSTAVSATASSYSASSGSTAQADARQKPRASRGSAPGGRSGSGATLPPTAIEIADCLTSAIPRYYTAGLDGVVDPGSGSKASSGSGPRSILTMSAQLILRGPMFGDKAGKSGSGNSCVNSNNPGGPSQWEELESRVLSRLKWVPWNPFVLDTRRSVLASVYTPYRPPPRSSSSFTAAPTAATLPSAATAASASVSLASKRSVGIMPNAGPVPTCLGAREGRDKAQGADRRRNERETSSKIPAVGLAASAAKQEHHRR